MSTNLRSYFIGVAWFILSLASSSVNDVITKYISSNMHSYEVTFFRFLFGTITLLPFIGYYGIGTIKTSRPYVHLMRGALLFLGMSGWSYGLTLSPVTTATIVSFTVPIFVLIFGVFFLKEQILWQRWFTTIIVFFGLIVTLAPNSNDFNPYMLVFIASAIAFALLDVINKMFIIAETMISMLFYSAIITVLLATPFALTHWTTPNMHDLILLFILGGSANLILFFILKAFSMVDATALAPYRYIELLFSSSIAFIVFNEIPGNSAIYGTLIIIPSTLFIIYSEKKEIKKHIKNNPADLELEKRRGTNE